MISVHDQYPVGTAAGGCYLCKAGFPKEIDGRVEKIVDLGVAILYEGRLVICELCIREAGNAIGMVSAQEAARLQAEVETMRDALAFAQSELRRLKDREADVAAREEWMASLLAKSESKVVDELVPDAVKLPEPVKK